MDRRTVLGLMAGGAAALIPTGRPTHKPKPPKPTPTPTPVSVRQQGGTVIIRPRTRTTAVALMGWELTPANVGLARLGIDGSSLPTYSGSKTPAQGTTISNMKITDTPIYCKNGNITIERCLIKPASHDVNGFGVICAKDTDDENAPNGFVIVRDCEIDGSLLADNQISNSCAIDGVFTAQRNYTHDTGSGMAIQAWFNGPDQNALLESNYIVSNRNYLDSHSDGLTVRNYDVGSEFACNIRYNFVNCSSSSSTGALFFSVFSGKNMRNVTVTGNYALGNGYQCQLIQQDTSVYSNMRIINNRVSDTDFGSGYVSGGVGWAEQSENYVYDAGQPDGKGAPVTFE